MQNFIVTPLLGEQVGIQWRGLNYESKDKTYANGIPLILGFFKRGTPYKIVSVSSENIDAILGKTPKNQHYRTIKSMLNSGIQYVNVLVLGAWKEPITENQNPIDKPTLSNSQFLTLSRNGGVEGKDVPQINVFNSYTDQTIKQVVQGKSLNNNISDALSDAFAQIGIEISFSEQEKKLIFNNLETTDKYFELALNQYYLEGEEVHFIKPKSDGVTYGDEDYDQQNAQIKLGGKS